MKIELIVFCIIVALAVIGLSAWAQKLRRRRAAIRHEAEILRGSRELAYPTLLTAAAPLVDFLHRNYDPHVVAVVEYDHVTVYRAEDGLGVPVED